ncbi:MAG TPA: glycoside hydrolase family 15 protein [Thermoplasmata archaeon]
MQARGDRVAFGSPGIEPTWSHSNKEGVGTALSGDSRLWFTLWRGIVTEVYYHRIDLPQLRDLEFLLSDGARFFHEEKRDLSTTTSRGSDHALAYRTLAQGPGGGYRLRKDILTDPQLPCLLVRTRLDILSPELVGRLRLYVLAAPHLDVGGWGNTATVYDVLGRSVLAAEKEGVAVALGATLPFVRSSVGFVGASDGWTDLSAHRAMTWEFDQAPSGNVALTGELPTSVSTEFTLGLAFGETIQSAVTRLFQSLSIPFDDHHRRFVEQWSRSGARERKLSHRSHDDGKLYRTSRSVLLAHEDKLYPGAFIASLSIPWGASRTDRERGGYHLVWTRDMVHVATALLASDSLDAPLRALVYLTTRQRPDGGFPQNFWVDGTPYWQGLQLDEVALPVLLAYRLSQADALAEFDPSPMVLRAAQFLVEHGPVTEQDRWEEVSGYSPSTLAATISALTVAGRFARRRGDSSTADFVQEYADHLEAHLEPWTVTRVGTLFPGIPRHYVRIRPAPIDDPVPHEGPDLGTVRLPNTAPGSGNLFPASEVVDSGFLDLVRFGVRAPQDPLIEDSVRVVDSALRVDTPAGPAWRRYNHDGYGERDDGSAYLNWGVGRAWPLLTGERGHFELARGHDPVPYLETMERFATGNGLLTEQVWDQADRPELHLWRGGPTGAAMPLTWAHAEYISLLRSASDGRVFDLVPEVFERYGRTGRRAPPREVWKFNRRPSTIPPGDSLRVIADQPFRLRVSDDDWRTHSDQDSSETGLSLHYVDLPPLGSPGRSWSFTFYWPVHDRWEGTDFRTTASG